MVWNILIQIRFAWKQRSKCPGSPHALSTQCAGQVPNTAAPGPGGSRNPGDLGEPGKGGVRSGSQMGQAAPLAGGEEGLTGHFIRTCVGPSRELARTGASLWEPGG